LTNNEILKKQIQILKNKHQEYIAKSNMAHNSANVYVQQASVMTDAIGVLEKALVPEEPSPILIGIPRLIIECELLKMEGALGLKRKDGKSLNDPSLPNEFVVRIVD